jgi:pseudaminic acid cytidylyltransferase
MHKDNRLLLKPSASPDGDGSTSSPRARQLDPLILSLSKDRPAVPGVAAKGEAWEPVEVCEFQKRYDKCLAIIPARGGSKRIPRKNIKLFLGKPIIQYSIDAARSANLFDEIMVSTEDKEIATVAESCGAKVPFFRSEQTSSDYATIGDVIEEVLLEYKNRGCEFEYFCCILATAPFVTVDRLIQTFELLKNSDADSIIPVTRFSYPIQRALKIEDEKLKMFWPENYSKRSQDLTPTYHDCGQFFWMRVDSFLEQKTVFAKNTLPFEIPESETQDIDTIQDWKIAEFKYKIIHNI